ncbi:biogenesis of lysosome-related organelles complex 1 subunit 4 [Galendromus occidentalis]|uniref:Biogenesis of lysosome-related organelles complex 1 subunit 4 n=1 Tax=Galendromus occidentalis TaxID=34638 RepID=A0AAJ6VW46_9ACAR|nr:biogenesis of lysosome-related organelles complex 1 subunit 4 [Galendromus occidentalis]
MAEKTPLLATRLARSVSADFAEMALADISEGKTALDERCDFLLTKLDAFIQIISIVGNNTEFLSMNLPKVEAARESLKEVYAQIDQLDALVSEVKSSVQSMEQKVEEAEKQFTTSYQMKFFKVLQSALGAQGDNSNQYRRQIRFEPPEIFKTEDFFPKERSQNECHPR